MRAALLREFHAPLRVEEVTVAAPQAGEVLVKVAASGVCGSDLKSIAGTSPVVSHLPCVLGHESAGVVEAVGPGVASVKPGDHVIIAMNGPCGRCRNCARGRAHLCSGRARMTAIMGLMADGSTRLSIGGEVVRPYIGIGSFAERAVVGEAMCVKVAEDAPLDLLALTACGVVTGVGAVLNTARVEPGSSVLVVGCGGVGLNVVQGAVLAGATTIIAADVVDAKLKLAEEFGATHTVLADDLPKQVGGIVRGGADYAFDVTGVPAVLAKAFAATQPGGTTVMVGSPAAGKNLEIPPAQLFGSRRLMGTQGGDATPARDLPMLVDLYRRGRLNLAGLVSERVPLDEINEAVEHVKSGAVARSVIVFD
ncbi:alcohol dehydrogenase catalytic domain-containing protein [Actinomadura parmotrematis]|uniref:Alcohol dehydrogenase catalytic domain-containing protein n=1 Tax=Actinomadura parmotrematis TaxID=2864039 RepID=A0ABS7FTW1_9ACTN|nr:alcohol dehydrogenase catalytic domain-containing protein [Actinomadura parmotrematis]MBW8483731.1 alcohol dehydrogenase catalytic domain-containing protein [Actinomadura parmotrematis]